MSAFKKIAGLVAGVSAVGAIGVAVAQGVEPNPHVSNPALGAGEQTVNLTPIGETGVLAEVNTIPQQAASLTKLDEQAAVASPPAQEEPAQPVASAEPQASGTSSQQFAQAPLDENNGNGNAQSMGAAPAPRSDRG